MIALQRHVQSLEEQLLRKDTGASAQGSCERRSPHSHWGRGACGVHRHSTDGKTGKCLFTFTYYFCSIRFINNVKLCLQDEVFLYTQEGDKVAAGLTQPQLGGYDSYCHNQLVGHGNTRVLVQNSMVLAPQIYPTNEMHTTVDAIGSFVIWPEYLLISVNASVS